MISVNILIGFRFGKDKEIDVIYRLHAKEKGGDYMKRILVTFLLITMMSFSFTVPAMAVGTIVTEPISSTTTQGIVPATEMTQIYWRWNNGVLQYRVWSLTNGRWLTDWINF